MFVDDFQFIAKTKKLRFWQTSHCSKCKEPLGFMILKNSVFFDECCQGRTVDGVRASTWGELARNVSTTFIPIKY
jgi:hypothetical protein